MISPELLRRYPFFGHFSQAQLETLAMLAEDVWLKDNQAVLEEGKPAQVLYFLLEGGIDLYYTVKESSHHAKGKEVLVCQVNVGEPFGISTLIEPHVLTASARSNGASRVIQFYGNALKSAMAADPALELVFVRETAKVAIQRLNATRTQLAAAWS